MMQIKYTKNLNPGRFELGTTFSWPNRSIPGPKLKSYDYIAPNTKTTMYTSQCKTLFFMLIL